MRPLVKEREWPFGPSVVLHGKDAVRFLNEIRDPKPASEEEVLKCREAYEQVKRISVCVLFK